MDEANRPNRPLRKPRSGPPGNPITPFNRTGKLPPLPEAQPETPASQASPFMVRLDPNGKPGEFNFVIDGPQAISKVIAQGEGLEAEASGVIPPVLYKAVDEILGFIYGLDQQFEDRGRRPRK